MSTVDNVGDITILHGDCRELLPTLGAGSVDAVITDPPSGTAFMGKSWDTFKCRGSFIAFMTGVMAECLRVAKPGARALVWAIPRTSHWTGTAIEDAGWIIEDRVSHLFAQGFPKGKSRLKPACEDWWMARKASKGVPPLNIDESRIGTDDILNGGAYSGSNYHQSNIYKIGGNPKPNRDFVQPSGRWPANVVLSHAEGCRQVGTKRVKGQNPKYRNPGKGGERRLDFGMGSRPEGIGIGHADPDGMETVDSWSCVDGCPVFELDHQSGILTSGKSGPDGSRRNQPDRDQGIYGGGKGLWTEEGPPGSLYGDSGGASRYFFCAKASREDRGRDNTHPTVKNTELMAWLIKLITQPGDLVLDPFAGSGSTLVSCYETDRRAIGIEMNEEYVAIIRRRLKDAVHPLFAGLEEG